jgi:hypothetical protein
MKKMKYTLYLLGLLFLFNSPAQAQEAAKCGTHVTAEEMETFYQRDKSHLSNKSGNYPEVYIPIVYHIVGDNNGNGYYGLEELFRSHCELKSLFDEANVNFYIKDINYVNNTNFFNGEGTQGLFFAYNDRDACNVFIVNSMDGVCGYSYVLGGGPNRGGIMLAINCMQTGNMTYRHEMGHYLNLPHTFSGWENQAPPGIGSNAPSFINGSQVERADLSNCLNSGDGFCDTPPDYIGDRWSCNFTRNYRDPLGNIFEVDEKNFMSYSSDGCGIYLKDDQYAEVNAASGTYRPYLLNDPVPPILPLNVITGFSPDANAVNLNSNLLIISWNSVSNASYYHLQATLFNINNPTIDIVTQDTFYIVNTASTNQTYQWRVKPINFTNVCTPFTPIKEFSTSALSADFIITNSSCAGNSDGSIGININESGTFNYYWSCEDIFINSTIQNVNSSTISNLIPATYSIIVVRAGSGDTLVSQAQVLAPNEIMIEINQVGAGLTASITGGTPPYTFVWSTGSENLSLNNIANGDYNIIAVDQNGCQKSAIGTYNSQATPIRNVNDIIGAMIIAPNPAKSDLTKLLLTLEKASILQISLRDISGKLLFNDEVQADIGLNTYPLNLSEISNGIYFVNVSADGLRKSTKLVVNN